MLPVTRRGRSIFDDVFDVNRALSRFWNESGDWGAPTELIGSYPCDVREDDNHVYVDAELPGFKKEEINVTLENGILSIDAQRKAEEGQKGERHLTERRFHRVARSFTLPTQVDEGNVEARLQDGVLHLKLSKREEVKPRKIEVK